LPEKVINPNINLESILIKNPVKLTQILSKSILVTAEPNRMLLRVWNLNPKHKKWKDGRCNKPLVVFWKSQKPWLWLWENGVFENEALNENLMTHLVWIEVNGWFWRDFEKWGWCGYCKESERKPWITENQFQLKL
jgi:hypothetical protein